MKRKEQGQFHFRTWGGKRDGAGPKRRLSGKDRLPHVARTRIPARLPVHVTLRIAEGVDSLRTKPALKVLIGAFSAARASLNMRITHFVVESNHLHLIVEGISGRAMKGLGVRIARRINRLCGTEGQVIGDRYDAVPLVCPAQVRNAIHYVLFNHKHHTGFGEPDEFTSLLQSQAVAEPRTWLLTHSHVRKGGPRLRPG